MSMVLLVLRKKDGSVRVYFGKIATAFELD